MLKSLLVLSIFLCLQFGDVWADETPVLLWGANSSSKPTMTLIRRKEFADLMKPLFDETAVVAFLEPNLTSIDFMCRNFATGNSCYTYMKNVVPRTYYARVDSPVEVLKALATQVEIHSTDAASALGQSNPCQTGKLTIISLNQSDTERSMHLQSHDSAIANISQMTNCPIVYLYMSTPNTAPKTIRSRREVFKKKAFQDLGTFLRVPSFAIFFKNVTLVDKQNSTNIKLDLLEVTRDDSVVNVAISGSDNVTELKFDVILDHGYYRIHEFVLLGVHYRAFEVETPLKMSYFCGTLELRGNATKLIWHSLQFQGGAMLNPDEKFKFYDAWHCVGFFTPPILSGIFVMTLLIYITSIGVLWLMDITSNDRFEDPNREPIKIIFED